MQCNAMQKQSMIRMHIHYSAKIMHAVDENKNENYRKVQISLHSDSLKRYIAIWPLLSSIGEIEE